MKTEKQTEATPRPWIILNEEPSVDCAAIGHDPKKPLLAGVVGIQNAKLIVRAVNSHDKLISAIRNIVNTWETGDLAAAVNRARELADEAEGK